MRASCAACKKNDPIFELAPASDQRIVFYLLARASEVFAALIWCRLSALPRYRQARQPVAILFVSQYFMQAGQ